MCVAVEGRCERCVFSVNRHPACALVPVGGVVFRIDLTVPVGVVVRIDLAIPVGVEEVEVRRQFISLAATTAGESAPLGHPPLRKRLGIGRVCTVCRVAVSIQVVAYRVELRQGRDFDQSVTVGVVVARDRHGELLCHA